MNLESDEEFVESDNDDEGEENDEEEDNDEESRTNRRISKPIHESEMNGQPISQEKSTLLNLLQQIHSDITLKEELVGQLTRSQSEYSIMKEKYESKIKSLQETLEDLRQERDAAFKRIREYESGMVRDPLPSASINLLKSKYEERLKKMMNEVADWKKKYSDISKAMTSARKHEECVIKTLKATIENLKCK